MDDYIIDKSNDESLNKENNRLSISKTTTSLGSITNLQSSIFSDSGNTFSKKLYSS